MSQDTPTDDTGEPTLLERINAQARRERETAAATTSSGRALTSLGERAGWSGQSAYTVDQHAREGLLERARATQAWRQLLRCFARWQNVETHLDQRALERLADNMPVDPNAAETWTSDAARAHAVLRRHGITKDLVPRLTFGARERLVAGQQQADQDAGVDWSVVHDSFAALDVALRSAHATLPISLEDPGVWLRREDQRRAAGRGLGLADDQAGDLSRWALANAHQFDPGELRCWRIASPTWLALADKRLAAVQEIERPVACFVMPDAVPSGGWRLGPVLSLELIRLVCALGGQVDRELRSATLPADKATDLLGAVNVHTLHAGPKENLDSAQQLSRDLSGALGVRVSPGVPRDKRDRWGRILVTRSTYTAAANDVAGGQATREGQRVSQLRLRVLTFPVKKFTRSRLGSASHEGEAQTSAAVDLGEAIQAGVERGLPLLLSAEASGHLAGQVRVGRMKGRPGVLTLTSSDGLSATTRQVVAEQATSLLRALKGEGTEVTLDAGARQVLRMALARPLADDAILLGRQCEVAALKVVGSLVDASQVGSGKSITTGRALHHRAATTPRFRAMIVAEGRLLSQWRDELVAGAPGRGLAPLVPNAAVVVIDERASVAAQIRQHDRQTGDGALVCLVANSILDRYPSDLQAIDWHLLVADEVLRYVNPATEAHRALKQVRLGSAADCWLLTATPKGKSAEHLDVLVGLAVGDEAMIDERLNTREAGDLLDEVNAHRLRASYGPHLVRVTRQDMAAWMPEVRPAQPLAIEPDGALSDLLGAIRDGGRTAYRTLLEVMRELKTLDKGTELYQQALVEMSRAQATVLGNVNVFVDASVDPETLTHSKAALAQALVEQGAVEEAMRGGGDGLPLLRAITAQTLAGVAGEEQVIVFAERVWCLRQLARALNDRHGVRAHVADGSTRPADFAALKQGFSDGDFPVLCLSRIGHEGHNLQVASVICHLDMPWVQTGLEQRVGRAARPGSKHGYVQTYIPYIKGGGIEHVTSILADRAAGHHLLLDSFEGVSAAHSTVANQLGAITAAVADAKDAAGFAATAARLRVAAAVFGA